MIEYVVKYQNNYVSSYLFLKILPSLMAKDIKIQAILESEIFTVTFDFDEWPGNHSNDEECVRYFNESFYHLRHHYKTIYPEDEFSIEEMEKENVDNSKVYKIKYSINLLPQVGYFVDNDGEHCNEDVSIMSLAADSEEIEIFTTASLNNLIEFKWVSYGKRHHLLGCLMHFIYTFVFILYVSQACLYDDEDENKTTQKIYAILLLVGILYPAAYDCTQLIRGGIAEYVSDPVNFADLTYIWGSIANSFL